MISVLWTIIDLIVLSILTTIYFYIFRLIDWMLLESSNKYLLEFLMWMTPYSIMETCHPIRTLFWLRVILPNAAGLAVMKRAKEREAEEIAIKEFERVEVKKRCSKSQDLSFYIFLCLCVLGSKLGP